MPNGNQKQPIYTADFESAFEVQKLIKTRSCLLAAPVEIARSYGRCGSSDRAEAVLVEAFEKYKSEGKNFFAWFDLGLFLTTAPTWKNRKALRELLLLSAERLDVFKDYKALGIMYADLMQAAKESGEFDLAEQFYQSAAKVIYDIRSDKQRISYILDIAAFPFEQGCSDTMEILLEAIERTLSKMKSPRDSYLEIAQFFEKQGDPVRTLEFFDRIKRPGQYDIGRFRVMVPLLLSKYDPGEITSRWSVMFKATPKPARHVFMESFLRFFEEPSGYYLKSLSGENRRALAAWCIDTMKKNDPDSFADILPLFEMSNRPLEEAIDDILALAVVTNDVKFQKTFEAATILFRKGDKTGASDRLSQCESYFMALVPSWPAVKRREEAVKPAIGYGCCGQTQDALRVLNAAGAKDAFSGRINLEYWSDFSMVMIACGLSGEVRSSLPKVRKRLESLKRDKLVSTAYYVQILTMLGERDEVRNVIRQITEGLDIQRKEESDSNVDHALLQFIRALLCRPVGGQFISPFNIEEILDRFEDENM